VGPDAEFLASRIDALHRGGVGAEVRWLAGPPTFTAPVDEDWVAPRTVA
jgi:hypothetical protein